jgi:hypothetical protein
VRSAGANRVGPHGYRHSELCRFELCGDRNYAPHAMLLTRTRAPLAGLRKHSKLMHHDVNQQPAMCHV